MSYFNIISETTENTVVSEYTPVEKNASAYQSEAALEAEFIHMLQEQGYEYVCIRHEKDLIQNLRAQLEKLNGYCFTDSEWKQFFDSCVANKNDGIVEKTRRIQEDFVQVLHRDNGSSKNITLIDKKNIHNNFVQVLNQYEVSQSDGELKTTGTDIDRLMPPVSRFGKTNRSAKKQSVIERLKEFFEKYFGVI